ncbi:MAG: hypothetical protein ACNFW9_04910 [Candidatus Kerfeldbacteria bacterium]|jgi:hypothetical protein
MKNKKNLLIGSVAVIFMGLLAFFMFWIPSFFVDEFNYIDITYTTEGLDIVTDPKDLFEKNISKWTDVSAILKNSSQEECSVAIKSDTVNITLSLDSNLEYGVLFPKKENIIIEFCGVKKDIYIK